MPAGLLLAVVVACTPMPTCGDPPSFPATNCASPTPILRWDLPAHADGANDYPEELRIYHRESGGPWELTAVLPRWAIENEDGTAGYAYPQSAPVQRHCAACVGNALYEFAATWANSAGESATLSIPPVEICMPPLWSGPPAPYN